MAFHQYFSSDIFICIIGVQLISKAWGHTITNTALRYACSANTDQAFFLLCDVKTKMLVKCRKHGKKLGHGLMDSFVHKLTNSAASVLAMC